MIFVGGVLLFGGLHLLGSNLYHAPVPIQLIFRGAIFLATAFGMALDTTIRKRYGQWNPPYLKTPRFNPKMFVDKD